MKKSLIFVLVAILVASIALVACTGNTTTEETTVGTEETTVAEASTVSSTLVAAFKDIVANGTDLTALTIGEQLAQNEVIAAAAMGAMEVEAGYLNGFDNAEITGFDAGVMFAPMIGTIPFVGYVFTLSEGTEAVEFVKTLEENANLRCNICTSADEMVSAVEGNTVFFVMSPMSLEA